MDAKNIFIDRRFRLHKILAACNLFRNERLRNEPKLLRRKNVRPKIQIVFIVVDNLEGKHVSRRGAARLRPS
jgi:hypothetical protein